jgi:hypothetical protein
MYSMIFLGFSMNLLLCFHLRLQDILRADGVLVNPIKINQDSYVQFFNSIFYIFCKSIKLLLPSILFGESITNFCWENSSYIFVGKNHHIFH